MCLLRGTNSNFKCDAGHFSVRSQICEKRLLPSSVLHVCLSIRMDKLGSRGMDFHEILYLSSFR
jgi:hypothetical protein